MTDTGKQKTHLDAKTAATFALLLLAALLLGAFAGISQIPCAGCNANVRFIFSPGADEEIVSLIRSAQKSIDVEMYLFTSDTLVRELSDAQKRGVRVRVIMEPRVEDSRKDKVFGLLQELGVKMRWASFSYKLTHSKLILVDGRVALVGSINFSESALTRNREAAAVVEGEVVKELAATFEEDWANSVEEA